MRGAIKSKTWSRAGRGLRERRPSAVLLLTAIAVASCSSETVPLEGERDAAEHPVDTGLPGDAGGVADAAPDDAGPVLCRGVQCGPRERCNEWTRECQSLAVPYPPPGEDNGGQCTTDADCRSSGSRVEFQPLCITENGADFCTSYCDAPADWGVADTFPRGECPERSICFRMNQFNNEASTGRCVQECHDDQDCRTADGYFCRRTFDGRTYQNGYCAPAHCHSRGCSGWACHC